MNKVKYHEPVLLKEVLEYLHINNQAHIIDATLGTGGHTIEIIKSGAKLLGIEADEETLKIAEKRIIKAYPDSKSNTYKLVHGNFKDITEIAKENDCLQVSGVLFDLGVNNLQLTSPDRGMSFANPDADLDMRISQGTQGVKASDLLNGLRQDQMVQMFGQVLRTNESKRFAKEVVKKRNVSRISTVGDLVEISNKSIYEKGKLHPATRPFLALRMIVNSELENLTVALPKAFSLLKSGGRLVLISFHSGEDKVVKEIFRSFVKSDRGKLITKKPIIPSTKEILDNPKSRSAKLRVIERL